MNNTLFFVSPLSDEELRRHLQRLRGDAGLAPEASIIIPINAQADLLVAHNLLADLFSYRGSHRLEFVLVINNYPLDTPPDEIKLYRRLGANVVAVPNVRKPGEVIIISARALGARAAQAPITLHFDADVRIPDATALIDWYIQSLSSEYELAYTRVDFYGLPQKIATRVRMAIHYSSRWAKRTLMSIPTTRGSNYAIGRSLFLELYEAGKLSVDIQVGPAAKLAGARSRYSGRQNLRVYTSARKQSGRWLRLFPYFLHRLNYNLKAIPTSFRAVDRTSWKGFDEESQIREERSSPLAKENRS
jgi:hypothetical protein